MSILSAISDERRSETQSLHRTISWIASPASIVCIILLGATMSWWMIFRELREAEFARATDHHRLLAESAAQHVETSFYKSSSYFVMLGKAGLAFWDNDAESRYGFLGICFAGNEATLISTACAMGETALWVHETTVAKETISISEITHFEGQPSVILRAIPEGQAVFGILSLEEFQLVQSRIAFGEKGHAAIFDAAGRVVAHPNSRWQQEAKDISNLSIVEATLAKASGVARFYSPAQDAEMIAGHAYTNVPGWGVIVPQPAREFNRTAQRLAAVAVLPLAFGLLSVGVLFGAVLHTQKRFLRLIDEALSEFEGGEDRAPYQAFGFLKSVANLEYLSERFSLFANSLRHARKIEVNWREQMEANLKIASDLAESEKVRRRLVETSNAKEREEALGQLVGSVAHDVNNDLSIIRAHVDAVLQLPDISNDEARQSLLEILKATEKVKSLTRQLLSSGGRSKLDPILEDPRKTIKDAQSAARNIVDPKVQFLAEIPDACPSIFVDPHQLQVALTNLVLNAAEAVGGSGCITFRVSVIRIDPATQHPYQKLKPPVCVRLTVADNGRGMSEDELARAKEPFYTSKKFGSGSGLGLPMVANFAQRSGGCLRLESELGHGTSAHLTFPAQDVAATPAQDTSKMDEAILAKTILLVEDEPSLRPILKAVMERQGRTVEAIESGDDAVLRLDDGFVPDALVTDMVMPGDVQGDRLVAIVRKKLGNIPIVIMSGYSDSIHRDRIDFDDRVTFVQKPVSATDLLEKLDELIVK
jgi:signal transduction histidine kinase